MYSNFKIAVIGDVMLDIWVRGEVARLSPEAPVPVILNPTTEYSLGGAGNVAANIASLGAYPTLYSVMYSSSILSDLLVRARILWFGVVNDDRELTRKKRILADGQQVCRIDTEDVSSISEVDGAQLFENLQLNEYDAFIIADYNKGVMTLSFIESVMDWARERDIPVMVDPKFQNFWEYKGATIFKPNRYEWETALLSGNNQFQEGMEHVVITKGADGMEIRARHGGEVKSIPAHPVAVADTTGAGDTVMAVLTLEYLRTGDIFKAAELANYAGALAVQRHGTAQLTVKELLDGWAKYNNTQEAG